MARAKNSVFLRLFFWLLLSLVAWEAYFISTQAYSRQLTASGEITSTSNTVHLLASQDGVLLDPIVAVGQRIEEGQILAVVRSPNATVQGFEKFAESSNMKSAETRSAMLESLKLREAIESSHQSRVQEIQRESQAIRQGLEVQSARLELLKERLNRLSAAQVDFAPADIDSAKLDYLTVQEAKSGSEAALSQLLQREQAERETYRQRLAELAVRERTLRIELGDIEMQRLEQQTNSNSPILAREAGMVSAVLVAPGQAVQRGQLLAILDRENTREEQFGVRMTMAPKNIGAIAPGKEIWIEVGSFPAREFGLFKGRVTSIVHLNGSQAKEQAFSIQATLLPRDITQFGKPVHLQKGMAVTASIVTDQLTLLEWLLEPVLIQFRRT